MISIGIFRKPCFNALARLEFQKFKGTWNLVASSILPSLWYSEIVVINWLFSIRMSLTVAWSCASPFCASEMFTADILQAMIKKFPVKCFSFNQQVSHLQTFMCGTSLYPLLFGFSDFVQMLLFVSHTKRNTNNISTSLYMFCQKKKMWLREYSENMTVKDFLNSREIRHHYFEPLRCLHL